MAKKKPMQHLYREGANERMLKEFKKKYGTGCVDVKGRCVPKYKYVYGATVGKMKRQYGF